MTTTESIIQATLTAHKQGLITLKNACELVLDITKPAI